MDNEEGRGGKKPIEIEEVPGDILGSIWNI